MEYLLYDGGTMFSFWYNFFGVDVIRETDSLKIKKIEGSSTFKNMENFPSKDSLKFIDGSLVVKLSSNS